MIVWLLILLTKRTGTFFLTDFLNPFLIQLSISILIFVLNRYGKPLVILLGSNNHDKTCVFGAALLDDETATTYDWVLGTFLECMGGKMPSSVLTDGCKAMMKALDNIMPGVPHRICSWHILKNSMHHVHNGSFQQDLKNFIFR